MLLDKPRIALQLLMLYDLGLHGIQHYLVLKNNSIATHILLLVEKDVKQ